MRALAPDPGTPGPDQTIFHHTTPNRELPMRALIALAVVGTVAGSMWITFELLARAAERIPVEP